MGLPGARLILPLSKEFGWESRGGDIECDGNPPGAIRELMAPVAAAIIVNLRRLRRVVTCTAISIIVRGYARPDMGASVAYR